jgi:hypothetical protein
LAQRAVTASGLPVPPEGESVISLHSAARTVKRQTRAASTGELSRRPPRPGSGPAKDAGWQLDKLTWRYLTSPAVQLYLPIPIGFSIAPRRPPEVALASTASRDTASSAVAGSGTPALHELALVHCVGKLDGAARLQVRGMATSHSRIDIGAAMYPRRVYPRRVHAGSTQSGATE